MDIEAEYASIGLTSTFSRGVSAEIFITARGLSRIGSRRQGARTDEGAKEQRLYSGDRERILPRERPRGLSAMKPTQGRQPISAQIPRPARK
ncbi:MAG: hypothetical protein M1825_002008 [Sarcosagium campestre]|nr:MAG: hypothetical protein M1825_002008 [Sarcosagium campestre]